jgi:hypothetical protein
MLISTSCAPVNNLHLITLLALDVHTVEVFTDLHVAGRNKFLRWPLGVETNKPIRGRSAVWNPIRLTNRGEVNS